MRPHQVFARLDPQHARRILLELNERSPALFGQALQVASRALNSRPVYLRRQPPEKRADAVRRAVSRVSADELAEELLAAYFIECRRPLLEEWLEALGLEHEHGILKADAPPPPPLEKLEQALARFRKGASPDDRELLIRAFAAQSAVDWPDLERLLEAS
jgi:hypothetical protein